MRNYRTALHHCFHRLMNKIATVFPVYVCRSDFPEGRMIGKPTEIGDFAVIDYGGNVTVGENVKIGYGVKILSVSSITGSKDKGCIRKPVIIGNNVETGSNAVVLPGVTIGDNSTVGACSVVNKDIPPNCVAVGSPARVVKMK